MARRIGKLEINLDSLTAQDLADVRAIAATGGVDAASVGKLDLSDPPVPVLAGLIYVTLRRESPGITPRRCTRLALAAKGLA